MPLGYLLDHDERSRIVAALIGCGSLAGPNERNRLVNALGDIGTRVPRADNARDDLSEIVRTAANFPGGIDLLVDCVREREGASIAMRDLDFIFKTVDSRLKLSFECWRHLNELGAALNVQAETLHRAWSRTLRHKVLRATPDSVLGAIVSLTHSGHQKLFEFLVRVAFDDTDDLRIDAWLDAAARELQAEAALTEVRRRIAEGDPDEPASLLIELREQDNAGPRGGEAPLHVSRAWIAVGDERPTPVYPPSDSKPSDIEKQPAEQVLRALLSEVRELSARPRVELIASRELLGRAYDEWRIKIGSTEAVLGAQMPVMLRWLDRMEDATLFQQWRRRWRDVAASDDCEVQLPDPRHALSPGEEESAMAELSSTTAPLVLLCCDPDGATDGGDVLKVALDAGTPIVLWLRGGGECATREPWLREIAARARPRALPDVVWSARNLAIKDRRPPSDPARRIALLYDDPERAPVSFRPRAPKRGER